ncbi:hypothetical protein KEM48_007452 [Puccinia striiformis f. sp. tritici PST-130]|nr:hypothetical protein KEM48_007452 [Puccinia striiformis f. sp. tritici PST-130]
MSAIEGYQRPQINIKSTRSLLTYRNAAEIRANLCWLTLMSKKEDTKPDPTRKIFYLYLSIELHSIAFFSYALQKAYTRPTSKSTKFLSLSLSSFKIVQEALACKRIHRA